MLITRSSHLQRSLAPERIEANAMSDHDRRFTTTQLPEPYDVLAPDTSEIRVLGRTARGSAAHGTLPVGMTALAIVHRTVDEIWYALSGAAEIWRKLGDQEEIISAVAGTALTIPCGTHFQFRTVGDEPFRFLMVTMPPWPGEDEAVMVEGHWPPGTGHA